MYIPRMNRIDDIETMASFMAHNNFAIVVSADNQTPIATHLPLTIHHDNDVVHVRSHFAKANPHWKSITQGEVLIIFSGPHAYISPTLYDKFESVPTWNYVTVHAYGKARLIDADSHPEELETIISDVINAHEPSYQAQWEQLPQRYKEGMKHGIIGVEIEITRLEGKAKLSQNKTTTEQKRIANSLLDHSESHIAQVGYAMNSVFSDDK